jgi:uncharacterized heparinase superfamily protein
MTSRTWPFGPDPGVVLRTALHLPPRQIVHQLKRRLAGPARRPKATALEGITGVAVPMPAPSPEGEPVEGGVALLNHPPHDPLQHGWEPDFGPLWLYTLHYHGWLQREPPARALATIEHWIANHKEGVGWEPYPTAMRALHWIGWLSRHAADLDGPTRRRLFASLAAQLRHLERHLELHLDGNHLWTDLAALACAALSLDGPRPVALGPMVARFAAVTDDQLNLDGMHRERTPTYHCLLAEQLAGAVALGPERVDPRTAPTLRKNLARMLAVLPAFTHPDGDVALWGDSQRGAPVTPTGLAARCNTDLARGTDHNAPASGLFRRAWGPWTLLWNAGGVGMAQQVGHIHADWLSFELSLGDERVVVDAGAGTYERVAERDYARSTRAHNTVAVADLDQHELWASHRIGGRGELTDLVFGPDLLSASVAGFRAPAVHRRRLSFDGRAIRCADWVLARGGRHVPATMRIHLPADCELHRDGAAFAVRTAGGRGFRISAPAELRWDRSPVPGWRAMFTPAPRHCLALPVPEGGLEIAFEADPE